MNNDNITYNQSVKEALALALFRLLETKTITQISVSEIIKLAGVSRSSFYRNFDTKEQILSDYIQYCYREYFKKHPVISLNDNNHFRLFLTYRFRFIFEHRHFFIILRKHNLLYYLFETFDPELSSMLSGSHFRTKYDKIFFSSCSAGIIQQWIDNGFKESVEEMVCILTQISDIFKK